MRYLILVLSMLLFTPLALNPTDANAQALANNMTCSQAQATFERNGRITIRTRGGTILPIYGGVPASQRGRLICGPFSTKSPKFVVTTDTRQCPISYKCS